MSGRCMEGVWKLSGRCLEGVWNPTYPIHINLTIFVVFLLRPNSIVIFRYQSPLRFGTLYFLKKRTSKMGWGSAVLSFLTFEHFSSVLNFLWKWASKFLVLNFLLDLAKNAIFSPKIDRNMAQNKPFFLQFWGFEPKDLTLRTNAKY